MKVVAAVRRTSASPLIAVLFVRTGSRNLGRMPQAYLTDQTMNSDRLTCILLEVAINGSKTNPHDSAEDAALRTQFAVQCAALTGPNAISDIPSEMP
jgi:hypothetical protein